MSSTAPIDDTTYVQSHWTEYRVWLGSEATQQQSFEAYCLMTGYEPLDVWIPWHLTAPDLEPSERDPTTMFRPVSAKFATGGTGGGKSEACLHETVRGIIENPGCPHLICAPTYDQIKKVTVLRFKEIMQTMQERGFPLLERFYGGEGGSSMHATIVGGGTLSLRSLTRFENLRGPEYATVWQDEADLIAVSGKVFATLLGRIRHPRALRLRYLGSSTPNGLDGTVAGRFIEARKDPANRRKWAMQRGNWYHNPHLPESYHDLNAEGMSSRRYRQEMNGEFLQAETVVYGEFKRYRHCIPYRFDINRPYVLGYDGGDQWEHATAFQQRANGSWIVFSEWISDPSRTEPQRDADFMKWIVSLGRYPQTIFADRNHEESIKRLKRMLARHGTKIDVMRSEDEISVPKGIEAVRSGLDPWDQTEPRLFFASELFGPAMHERSVATAMEQYRYMCFADGTIDVYSPLQDNKTEHAADSSRYGWVGINRIPRGPVVVDRHRRPQSRHPAYTTAR